MNNKEKCRLWYKKNKVYKLRYQNKYNKRTKYQNEKSEKERKLRYIKRRTRKLYPLEGKKCKFCKSKATEHHHIKPIRIKEFVFICHECHKILHYDRPKK